MAAGGGSGTGVEQRRDFWGHCRDFVALSFPNASGGLISRPGRTLSDFNVLMVGAPRFELGTPSPPDWGVQ
jgi:hypothetical protein